MFGSLSGGQRQRLFVALALVSEPEVVFLDEMTTGLDPAARRVTWELIEAIRDQGTTVVLVTHFMDEAERLCDRVAVLDRGRIIAEETPATLAMSAGRLRVTFTHGSDDLEWLAAVSGVAEVVRHGPAGRGLRQRTRSPCASLRLWPRTVWSRPTCSSSVRRSKTPSCA